MVRKLLVKYHDDKEMLQKQINAMAYNFNPHLAQCVRAKHIASYTSEEKQWASIDKILHPEVGLINLISMTTIPYIVI